MRYGLASFVPSIQTYIYTYMCVISNFVYWLPPPVLLEVQFSGATNSLEMQWATAEQGSVEDKERLWLPAVWVCPWGGSYRAQGSEFCQDRKLSCSQACSQQSWVEGCSFAALTSWSNLQTGFGEREPLAAIGRLAVGRRQPMGWEAPLFEPVG